MAKLKFPKLKSPLPKKPLIKGVDNNMLVGGIAIGGIITYYYLVKEGYIQAISIPGLPGIPGLAPEGGGNRVVFTIAPVQVMPNSTITIAGTVYGLDGQPMTVNKIYYYVYREHYAEDGGVLHYLHYASGIAGEFSSGFSKVIATTNYPPGQYLVVVSDTALTTPGGVLPAEIAGQNPPVEGQNTARFPQVNDVGDQITIS